MSEQRKKVLFKLSLLLLGVVAVLYLGQQFYSLDKQYHRVVKNTARIQELVAQIQAEPTGQQILHSDSQSIRDDIVPFAAQYAGLKSSAVARVRPEEVVNSTMGNSVRNTRVFLEQVDHAGFMKMLIAVEANGHSVVVTSVTIEYSARSDSWNAEFVFTSPVNDDS